MVLDTSVQVITEKLVRDDLPLAIYREVAAHLRQLDGMDVELEPQRSPTFDYHQSQIGAMVIRYPQDFSEEAKQRLDAILKFYGDRHGEWQREVIANN